MTKWERQSKETEEAIYLMPVTSLVIWLLVFCAFTTGVVFAVIFAIKEYPALWALAAFATLFVIGALIAIIKCIKRIRERRLLSKLEKIIKNNK